MAVTQKTQIAPVNGTPVKRMFWSIISDYDLKTGICELVDNALDLWTKSGRKKSLQIAVELSVSRQLISVFDNAGGVKRENLDLLISPGGSTNDPAATIIGIFGVGSKRASIALGERVQIKTRFKNEGSYELEIDTSWLGSADWNLPAYEIPNIKPGTTEVHISHLRKPFADFDVQEIEEHLGETYCYFLKSGCVIALNGKNVSPKSFQNWSFPPGYLPHRARFDAIISDKGKTSFEITAGLIGDRDKEKENYGVYFYCNERMIVKELRTREVGYQITSEAGVPHPDASLCRVIVELIGPAQDMPWNSSKSGINFGHPAFQVARPTLIQMASYFSSLSRRLKSDWNGKVFKFKTGVVEDVEPSDVTLKHPLILPPLPKVNKPRVEQLKSRNKAVIQNQPWTLGLVEAIAAVEVIDRQKFETKNRISLLLLDSNFEIALKEFIVHRTDLFPKSQYGASVILKLFKHRSDVVAELQKKVSIPQNLWDRADHYYDLRNKLIHERATVGITDADIKNYRGVIGKILKILFDLHV